MSLKLYTVNNSFHFHEKKSSGSATFKNKKEREYAYFLAGWHGQWSKFYYHKNFYVDIDKAILFLDKQ